jgi:hypothetical protein
LGLLNRRRGINDSLAPAGDYATKDCTIRPALLADKRYEAIYNWLDDTVDGVVVIVGEAFQFRGPAKRCSLRGALSLSALH